MKRAVSCVISLCQYLPGESRKKARLLEELEEENKHLRARYQDLSERCRTSFLRTEAQRKMLEAEVETRIVKMKLRCQRELTKAKLELLEAVDEEKGAMLIQECKERIAEPFVQHAASVGNLKYPWLEKKKFSIPTCLIRKISLYLSDDDLFKLRTVNSMFYGAFYNQTVRRIPMSNPRLWKQSRRFNSVRAMKLALMGRKFKNICSIVVPYSKRRTRSKPNKRLPSPKDLSVLIPLHFPKLEGIYLANLQLDTDIRHLPGHPGIKTLYVPVYSQIDFLFLNEEKFPQLKVLEIISVSGVQASVLEHSNLEIISFLDCDSVKWDDITKMNFPKLKAVYKMRKSAIPDYCKASLKSEGIEWVEEEIGTSVIQLHLAH